MAVRNLYFSATGVTGITEAVVTEGMSQPSTVCNLTASAHSLIVGDTVTVDLGYSDDHAVMLTDGIVRAINYKRPENTWEIQIWDKLARAEMYFLAPDDPDAPFQANNEEASVLVGRLLAEAGLTGADLETTPFTFAVVEPADIKLTYVWTALENINRITSCITYVDPGGTIHYSSRKPYLVGGDTPVEVLAAGTGQKVISYEWIESDDWLRNRVVVYGAQGVAANASASSPYLPGGFYKTLLVSHPLIDTVTEAQRTADINLTMFNRLTQTLTLNLLGSPARHTRDVLAVTLSDLLFDEEPFIAFACEHSLSAAGYTTRLTLTK